MSEIRRLVHLVRWPPQAMPAFFARPPIVHASFLRAIVPLVGLRSVAIFVRSSAQHASAAGLVMAVAAVVLQLLSWACFGWALVGLSRLCGINMQERQAFALSTAVSAPLWLGGIFYLIPEDPPALFRTGRLAVLMCGCWGAVMLAYAPFVSASRLPPRRRTLVAVSALSYAIIYALFFVATGFVATLVTLLWQAP